VTTQPADRLVVADSDSGVAKAAPTAAAGPGPLGSSAAALPVANLQIESFTQAHLERLERIAGQGSPGNGRPGRGLAAQQLLRDLEQSVRQGVVDFCRQARAQGWSQAEAAGCLEMSPRTLRHWTQQRRTGADLVRPRGRPLRVATPEQLQAVVTLLERLGPATGLAVLQGAFPELARAELQELLACYRQVWRGQHPRLLHVLHWQVPGRVWAMDYTQSPDPIDGLTRWILAVRDLASGQQLCWRAVPEATAAWTMVALEELFARLGVPLVLKSDNGSPFSAEATRNFLECMGVWWLFSPPRTPGYNGSCEAAIGAMKVRTEYEAQRQGHEKQPTSSDLEQARRNANATARPQGPRGATPDEAWQGRPPLGAAERQRFAETVAELRSLVRREWQWSQAEQRNWRQEAVLQREVLRRALVEHGYLLFTRRRIPIPIRRARAAKIT
jgi:transposase InsO family protein